MADEQAPAYREHDIEWDDQKVSRLWDYYSRTPPYSDIYFSKVCGRQMLRQSRLPLDEPLEVLDFGCGPGAIWDHLVRLKARWRYTGLDFSRSSISKLMENAAGYEHFRGAKHVASLPTDLPSAHFDVVLLFEVVEHLNDAYLDATLAEVGRLLKNGGVVVITTPNQEDLSLSTRLCPECGAIFNEWQHVRSWSVGSLSARMREGGFALRIAKTLDFTAQGFSRRELLKKLRRVARRLFEGDPGRPHMIAVFQKS
jgi:SAM-dependent methyltransferase